MPVAVHRGIIDREQLQEALLKFCQSRLAVATVAEIGAAALYSVDHDFFRVCKAEYQKRRDTVIKKLRQIPGVVVEEPMGAFYVTPELGKQCADAYLYNDFGSGWEWWPDFDRFHQIAIDELNAFNYDEYKANGFKVKHLGDCHCELYDRPEGFSSVPLIFR